MNRATDAVSVAAAAAVDVVAGEEGSPVLLAVAVGDEPLPVRTAVFAELGVGAGVADGLPGDVEMISSRGDMTCRVGVFLSVEPIRIKG